MSLALVVVGEVPSGCDLEPSERAVSALLGILPELPEGTINATFVDRATSQELNVRYSGNDYATDVLSWSYIEDGEPIEGVIGELAVCWEIAVEQAHEAGTTASEEVALLVVHGMLHVLGYDHQTEAEQDEVQRLHEQIMTAAGNKYRAFKWEQA